ncbi:MAG: hypothetical protein GEV05_28300 [Betaproteobacteria bacterium]|nr:hypothetical protein [Betaproteobacteria bacterium]
MSRQTDPDPREVDAWVLRFIAMLDDSDAPGHQHIGGVWAGEIAAAYILGKHPNTLRNWRLTGEGPRYYRLPEIRYDLRDMAAWVITRGCRFDLQIAPIRDKQIAPNGVSVPVVSGATDVNASLTVRTQETPRIGRHRRRPRRRA